MVKLKHLFFIFLILSLNSCEKKLNEKSRHALPLPVNQNSQKKLSPKITKADSLQLEVTKRLYDKFVSQTHENSEIEFSERLLDSILTSYKYVKNKKAQDAYSFYKTGWHFYMDRIDHVNAIKLIEDFIEINKNDTNHSTIQLLEAYSYLGSELSFSGQCDKAIEYSFEPFLKLYKNQIALYKKQEDIDFLKTGELMTYTGYLECASSLNDGNLQNKILTICEKLIEEQHDVIPWYNVYKSDLLGMMSTIYMSIGDLGKAKVLLDQYSAHMKPQDVVDDLLLSDRKMTYYAEIKDEEKFETEFKISKHHFSRALLQLPPNTEAYFLAVHNHRLAFERFAKLLANKDSTHTTIPNLYHKSLNMTKSVTYDNHINPLNAYRGLILYFNATQARDSATYYLKAYKDLALKLNVVDDIRDTRVYYLENYLIEKKYKYVDSLLNEHLKSLHITDVKKFLTQDGANNKVLANEKTISRLVKMAKILERHAKINPSFGNAQSHEFYLLASALLNALKQNQWFNPKEIKQLEQINAGILSTRTASAANDNLIIKFLENNKSLELLQKNANNHINLKENVTLDSLVKKRERVSRQILNLTNRYLHATNDTIENDQQKYIELLNKRTQINLDIKNENPKYVLYTSSDFDVTAYRSNLDDNTVAIRFYFTDTSCYAYVISKDSLEYFDLGTRQKFTDLIKDFRQKIKNQQYLEKTIASLNTLLKPLFTAVLPYRNYKIIPHEELNYLPFEVLFGSITTSNKVISYNTSLILDSFSHKKTDHTEFAAYTPNYEYNNTIASTDIIKEIERSGNYTLPNALEESAYISNLFKGAFFKDKDATKKHFMTHAPKFSILHLAMHAVVNNSYDTPKAMLLFTGTKEEDYLSINEIYNLNLDADLTTLSACNTGYGKIDPVEGVLSLSRAFQYAGSKSTLTSLWRVPDKQTSEIMKQFYTHLKQGYSKSEALKMSKQNYLKTTDDANLKHPYYWAGFVLTGDTSAIISPTHYWWYVIISFALILIIFLVVKRRLKPKS